LTYTLRLQQFEESGSYQGGGYVDKISIELHFEVTSFQARALGKRIAHLASEKAKVKVFLENEEEITEVK
jgi:hypothetical protein